MRRLLAVGMLHIAGLGPHQVPQCGTDGAIGADEGGAQLLIIQARAEIEQFEIGPGIVLEQRHEHAVAGQFSLGWVWVHLASRSWSCTASSSCGPASALTGKRWPLSGSYQPVCKV